MLLTEEKSLCKRHQKRIVSQDKGTARQHRMANPQQKYSVRHYRLEGDLVKQQKCCDFLLLNDTLEKAYLIELKGGNIDEAVPQLKRGAVVCAAELPAYKLYYRIVASKVRIHDIKSNTFRKFKDKYGSGLKYAINLLEEKLE